MGIKIDAKLIGLQDLLDKIKVGEMMAKPMTQFFHRVGQAVEAQAKEDVAVDRGQLRSKITYEIDPSGERAGGRPVPVWVRVGTNVTHGAPVHQGRKPGKWPPVKAIAGWVKRKGLPPEAAFPIARKIAQKGIKARPFLTDAVEKASGKIDRFVERLAQDIEEQWGK